MARYVVARADAVDEGGNILVEVAGRPVGIFKVDGEYYGLLNRCPHRGGPMCEGVIMSHLESNSPGDLRYDTTRKFLTCPWHGWEFDIKTGQSFCDPHLMKLRAYPVDVEAGDLVAEELAHGNGTSLVPGPYTAEKIEVSVEDDYLVVVTR